MPTTLSCTLFIFVATSGNDFSLCLRMTTASVAFLRADSDMVVALSMVNYMKKLLSLF